MSRINFFFLFSAQAICCFGFGQELLPDSFAATLHLPDSSAIVQASDPCLEALEITVSSETEIAFSSGNTPFSKDGNGNFEITYPEIQHVSFWYKIKFQVDCELTFSIFPGKPTDIYNFFIYKNPGEEFCEKLRLKKVFPARANLYNEPVGNAGTGLSKDVVINYKDSVQRRKVLFQMPYHDAIQAKAGEEYFLNVYHVEGKDCDHNITLKACQGQFSLTTKHERCSNANAKFNKVNLVVVDTTQNAESKKDSTLAGGTNKGKKTGNIGELQEGGTGDSGGGPGNSKSKPKVKLAPQLVQLYEPDTLKQYILEGEILYTHENKDPLVKVEIFLANADGSITILKKMYTNEKGAFRFANLPSDHNYILGLNIDDPNLIPGQEPRLTGKMTLNGQPAAGITINRSLKTGTDGSFVLTGKELFTLNINELFNRWSIDLSNPAAYNEMIRKFGGVVIEGLIYRVQIGAYREEVNFNYSFMEDLGKVDKELLQDGITRFVMGEFKTLGEANDFRQKAYSRKINDAFILAYFNGSKKYLEELIEKKMLEKQ